MKLATLLGINLLFLLSASPLTIMGSTLVSKGTFPVFISLMVAGAIIIQVWALTLSSKYKLEKEKFGK